MTRTMKVLVSILLVLLLGVAALAVAMSHTSACGVAPAVPTGAQTMRGITYRCYGSPDVVKLEQMVKPAVTDSRVLIKVQASSVNPLDWHMLEGKPYMVRPIAGWGAPKNVQLGTDFAGTVEAVGPGVTRFKPGDRVYGGADGAFAEYLVRREQGAIAPMPANLTFEQAAAVPVAGVTALQAVRDSGHVRPGDKVLVNGAGGGVGTFIVQIAKAFGANVTAVTSTGNLALVQSLGADRTIDYTKEDFTRGGERYDVILDCGGGHPASAYRRVLMPRGRFVGVGEARMGNWIEPIDTLFIKPVVLSRLGSQKFMAVMANIDAPDLTTLRDLIESGKVKPVIDRRYPLAQTAEAIRYLETGHARGKVVIDVQ
jgi:NADPH:quinone reductase-like Zn-dependent oxidoreductase